MHMAELEMKEDIARENTLKVKKTNGGEGESQAESKEILKERKHKFKSGGDQKSNLYFI